jgi:hypothetical protein
MRCDAAMRCDACVRACVRACVCSGALPSGPRSHIFHHPRRAGTFASTNAPPSSVTSSIPLTVSLVEALPHGSIRLLLCQREGAGRQFEPTTTDGRHQPSDNDGVYRAGACPSSTSLWVGPSGTGDETADFKNPSHVASYWLLDTGCTGRFRSRSLKNRSSGH